MANKTVADVMKMVKDNEVKFVDFRFTDTRGKQQHTTVPVSHFDEDKFISGHAFDGSSIAGWKGIEASDMILLPDPETAFIDPFFEETTVVVTCDVIEPSTIGVSVSPLTTASSHVHPDPTRTRKLLLHKKEIARLIGKVARAGYTLVPLDMHYQKGRIKLEVGLAKGKRQFEKRASEADKDWKREQNRLLKQRSR